MTNEISCIILAAGKGTRMKSDRPKVMHTIAGWPLVKHVVTACEGLKPATIVTVIASGMDDVAATVAPHPTAIQENQLGTGDAARAGLAALKDTKGHVLILAGDVPLIQTDTLIALVEAARDSGFAMLAMQPQDPTGYGRLIIEDDVVTDIVEDRDCTPEQKSIDIVNAGAFCINAQKLPGLLAKLEPANAQKEFYLTDIVRLAAKDGQVCDYILVPEYEVMGINNRSQLAEVESEMQNMLRARAMHDGTTLIDPMTVYFSVDTMLGRDTVIEPNVFFGPGVRIGDNVTIHAFTHLEGVTIEDGASIGPFARVRPKSHIGAGATIGNFVEVNRSTVKAGAKSKHVSYLGDAIIGTKSNIGAGTVIANYDGFDKQESVIGDQVFIGSNSTLVAPLHIGDGAYVAAGSVITTNVPDDALAVARSREVLRDGWATEYRSKKKSSQTKKAKK